MFSGMAKTRQIARRLHDSIKIECSGARKWHQNLKKMLRKPIQKRMRKMMLNLTEFGGQMEPTWSQKGIRKSMYFLARFLEASGNIGGASTERRRSVETAARVTLSPADPPGRRLIIKEYCRIINKDRDGFRI